MQFQGSDSSETKSFRCVCSTSALYWPVTKLPESQEVPHMDKVSKIQEKDKVETDVGDCYYPSPHTI